MSILHTQNIYTLEIRYDIRLYSELNTISRYALGTPTNNSLTTVIYCNQFVGDDKKSIYGISCHEFGGLPSQHQLDGNDEYFYLYPIGDNRPYSDVILYGVENVNDDDFKLSSNFSLIEHLVSNENYVYRGILGECSSDPDPLNDSSFKPIYEYRNIISPSSPWHVYTIIESEKNKYDNRSADWQDLGIPCYVPNNPGLYIFMQRFSDII